MLRRLFSAIFAITAISGGSTLASEFDLTDDAVAYMTTPPDDTFWIKGDHWTMVTKKVTPEALSLIRRVVLTLDAAEVGAPKLSGQRPFGSTTPWEDIAQAFGTTDDHATAVALVDFTKQLIDFTTRAELAPGTYAMKNRRADDLRKDMDWLQADDAYLGLTLDGKVIVTGDHLKLLKQGMLWEWPNRHDVGDAFDFGQWPMPGIDPKRPYGEMSFYQLDVHRILGWPVEARNDKGYIELTDAQIEAASRLHTQMIGVLQVFLERAELPN